MNDFDPTTPTGKPSDTATLEDFGAMFEEPQAVTEARKAQRTAFDAMSPDAQWLWIEQQNEEDLLRFLAGRY